MAAYTTRMPMGFAGLLTRDPQQAIVEMAYITATSANVPAAYGVPVVDDGTGACRAFQSGDTAASISGVIIRAYPTQSTTNAYGSPVPVASQGFNRLLAGYFAAY